MCKKTGGQRWKWLIQAAMVQCQGNHCFIPYLQKHSIRSIHRKIFEFPWKFFTVLQLHLSSLRAKIFFFSPFSSHYQRAHFHITSRRNRRALNHRKWLLIQLMTCWDHIRDFYYWSFCKSRDKVVLPGRPWSTLGPGAPRFIFTWQARAQAICKISDASKCASKRANWTTLEFFHLQSEESDCTASDIVRIKSLHFRNL